MKKSCLIEQRSFSPSKSVHFGFDGAAAVADVTNGGNPDAANTSLGAYVNQLKKALRRRPDDLHEVIGAIRDILRTTAIERESLLLSGNRIRSRSRSAMLAATAPVDLIERIERIITLLEGNPALVSGLAAILPPEYSIDIQPDAVIVKVYEAGGDCSMVDTGHSRAVDDNINGESHLGTPSSTSSQTARYRPSSPRNVRRRLSARRNVHGGNSFRRKTMSTSSPVAAVNVSTTTSRPWTANVSLRRTGGSRLQATTVTSTTSLAEVMVGGVFSDGIGGTTTRILTPTSKTDAAHRSVVARSTPTMGSPGRSRKRRSPTRARLSPSMTSTRSASAAVAAVSRLAINSTSSARRRRTDENSAAADDPLTGGTAYIREIKRALAKRPEVYDKFLGFVKLYHQQRNRSRTSTRSNAEDGALNENGNYLHAEGENDDVVDDDESTYSQLESIREVVTLLRDQPHLVLGFNDFLPDGYKIRMFDRSAYVIDYPLIAVTTTGGGRDVGVGRITVPI